MKIVCLANSFREGGRCLGGIALDDDNNPVFVNNRPKWIRPIIDTVNEEVPNELVTHIALLDIVEFTAIQDAGHGHQSENVLFDKKSIRTNGKFPIEKLGEITDNKNYSVIFGNKGKAVPEHKVEELDHSLMLLEINEFEINEKKYDDKYYPQIRLSFKYKGNLYDFPITDPNFLRKYGLNSNLLKDKNKIFTSLSLAAPHDEWSSKLVAGLIFENNATFTPIVTFENDLPF